jgi:hypothetical protein
MSLSCNSQSSDPILDGGGGGGGGDVPHCSRGGKKLKSNMGAKVNIDVEDGDMDGDMDEDEVGDEGGDGDDGDRDDEDIDEMFELIDEGSKGNDEHSSRPDRPVTRPFLETQVLSTATIHLLSTLAGSSRAVTSSSTASVFNSASAVLKSLTAGHSWDSIQSSFKENTLLAIAQRCELSEKLVESSQVIYSLNLIQFRTKIES